MFICYSWSPLFIVLVYINDLADNLVSLPKLFTDVTSLFSVVKNKCIIEIMTRLTLYFIMLKNGQTYFKNLAVFTPQDF